MHSVILIVISIFCTISAFPTFEDPVTENTNQNAPSDALGLPSGTSEQSYHCNYGYTYPSASTIFLVIYSLIWTTFGMLVLVKFRSFVRMYIADNFAYFPRMRTDLRFELLLTSCIGSEVLHQARLGNPGSTELVPIEHPTLNAGDSRSQFDHISIDMPVD